MPIAHYLLAIGAVAAISGLVCSMYVFFVKRRAVRKTLLFDASADLTEPKAEMKDIHGLRAEIATLMDAVKQAQANLSDSERHEKTMDFLVEHVVEAVYHMQTGQARWREEQAKVLRNMQRLSAEATHIKVSMMEMHEFGTWLIAAFLSVSVALATWIAAFLLTQ